MNPKYFLLIVGCSRSGTTIANTVLNYHQQIHIAWETKYSLNFWRDLPHKNKYWQDLSKIADRQIKSKDAQGGYVYSTEKAKLAKNKDILVIGEKIWNPSLLLLSGQYDSISNLEKVLEVPIKIVNCIRHPQDVVATMCLRNNITDEAGICDRLNWLEQHLLATASLKQKVKPENLYDCYHEGLILNPQQTIAELISFLDLDLAKIDLDAVANILFDRPKLTRDEITWSQENLQRISDMYQRYDWLERYTQ